MVKKYFFYFFCLVIIIASIVFFMQKNTNNASANNNQHLTILLDWYISEDQAPLLIAQINGYFTQHHLDVELVELSDASEAPKLLARHQADLAISYGGSYLHQLQQGLPVKQIGTLIDHPLNCLIYLPQSGIHQPKDLKGKKVGFTDPNDDFRLLKAVLNAGGLAMDDITLVNIQNTIIQSILLGKIDIATDMMRNIEPVVIAHHGFTVGMFCPEDFGVPNYPELIYIISNETTPNKIMAFLQAVTEATRYIEQNPEAAWDKLKAVYPKFNSDIHYDIWGETYPLFAPQPEKV